MHLKGRACRVDLKANCVTVEMPCCIDINSLLQLASYL